MVVETDVQDLPTQPNVVIQNLYPYKFLHAFEWKEFACGCGAAFINISISYPLYKMIFRQMLHGVRFSSAFGQLRHEGLGYLYRGMLPPMAQKTISLSIMFGVYDGTRRFLVDELSVNGYIAKVMGGITAGSVEAALLPFERVQTLLAHSKYHEYFSNTPRAFRYVWVNHGYRELYRGIVPVLMRNGPSNAIFFMMREEANIRLPVTTSASTKAAQEFFAGALIGATISTFFYPLNVIKVAMQSDMGHKSESVLTACKRIYHTRGSRIGNFYRGCVINACRSFVSWGIMNAAYENIRQFLY